MGNGIVETVEVSSLAQQEFVAISYRWTEAITSWRAQVMKYGRHQPNYHGKLMTGSEMLSKMTSKLSLINDASVFEGHRFLTQVAYHVLSEQKRYFWMDIICIDQDKPEEKAFFIPKMGTLYGTAVDTHAYPTGTSFLPSLSTPELYFPVWETRAWTLQEHIQSRSVTFIYLFEGHLAQEAIKISTTASGTSAERQKLSQKLDCFSGMVHIDGVETEQNFCLLWQSSTEVTTSVIEQESWTGGLPMGAFLATYMVPRFARSRHTASDEGADLVSIPSSNPPHIAVKMYSYRHPLDLTDNTFANVTRSDDTRSLTAHGTS